MSFNSQNPTKPIPSLLSSPRLFNGFFMTKPLSLQDSSSSSPTSILDTKNLFSKSENNPFEFKQNPPKPTNSFQEFKNPFEKSKSLNGIALALVLFQETPNNAIRRNVLFGSNLKIRIPPNGSPEYACDFGIKTRSFRTLDSPNSSGSGRSMGGLLSLSEMELKEEYTRVICHGSNPKTTHIYDDCVVGSCDYSDLGPESPLESFLSFCHTCKKNIEEDDDIFIYRGGKGFCSEECRCQEMISDGLIT